MGCRSGVYWLIGPVGLLLLLRVELLKGGNKPIFSRSNIEQGQRTKFTPNRPKKAATSEALSRLPRVTLATVFSEERV